MKPIVVALCLGLLPLVHLHDEVEVALALTAVYITRAHQTLQEKTTRPTVVLSVHTHVFGVFLSIHRGCGEWGGPVWLEQAATFAQDRGEELVILC